MNNLRKVKVSPTTASELLAAGVRIECYAWLPVTEPVSSDAVGKTRRYTSPDQLVQLSLEGREPLPGSKLAVAWRKVRRSLFKDDPSVQVAYSRLRAAMRNAGYKEAHTLLYKNKVVKLAAK